MKFGKTRAQRRQNCRNYIEEKLKSGYIKFAWKPVKLTDGTYVWLEKYWIDLRCRDAERVYNRLDDKNLIDRPQCMFSELIVDKFTLEDAIVIKLKR